MYIYLQKLWMIAEDMKKKKHCLILDFCHDQYDLEGIKIENKARKKDAIIFNYVTFQ